MDRLNSLINRSRQPFAAGLVFLLACAASGCGLATPSATLGSANTETDVPASAPVVSDADVRGAQVFRRQYGLRADLTWVRAVAANPEAQVGVPEFGYPLMPDEFADLMGRGWDAELFPQVRAYGLLFPDDFAGAYESIELNRVVISFKANAGRHRSALSNLVPGGSFVEVRKVDWSLNDLDSFAEQIDADEAWFESIGATVHAFGNIVTNTVDANFKGPQGVAGLIEQHYGNPSWLRAKWAGAVPWQGLRADLTIEVVDTDGQAVQNVRCVFAPLDPLVDADSETPYGTGSTGRCVLGNLPVVAYRIRLFEVTQDDQDMGQPLKEFHVDLAPEGSAIRVVVTSD